MMVPGFVSAGDLYLGPQPFVDLNDRSVKIRILQKQHFKYWVYQLIGFLEINHLAWKKHMLFV